MSKKPLTCQSRHVDIVIRKNIEIPTSKIREYCINNFERYAFIEHKGDIQPSTGEVEGVHYHIVGDMIGVKIPFSTRLNTIRDFFKFDNLDGVQIDQYRTFEGALQYLTHKNQAEKTPHKVEEIVHNLSDADFKIFYESDIGNVVTFDLIYLACKQANNIVEVINTLGIGNYRIWRSVIWDVWKCLNGDAETQKRAENKELPF